MTTFVLFVALFLANVVWELSMTGKFLPEFGWATPLWLRVLAFGGVPIAIAFLLVGAFVDTLALRRNEERPEEPR